MGDNPNDDNFVSMSNDDFKKMIAGHIMTHPIGIPFRGCSASEAKARADGQAEVGVMLAGLINDLNSFVGNSSVENYLQHPGAKKVSGKLGIEEMIDYLRIRIKDLVFDLEATHRELAERIDNDEFNC